MLIHPYCTDAYLKTSYVQSGNGREITSNTTSSADNLDNISEGDCFSFVNVLNNYSIGGSAVSKTAATSNSTTSNAPYTS